VTVYAEPRLQTPATKVPPPQRRAPAMRFRRRAAVADLLVVTAWASGALAAALYLASLLVLRGMNATGVVLAECSSAV